jgi:ornithine carbamoyltransferase
MTTVTPARSFLRVSDLDQGELTSLLDLASTMRANPTGWR